MVTRFPHPGRTKTRLIPALGAEGAAQVQRCMTELLVDRLRVICDRASIALEIHFADGSLAQMHDWLGDDLTFKPQGPGHLGARLHRAFWQGFRAGQQPILIIGSDCPDVGEGQITQAVAALQHHDVVLGPAHDGGYYLIGLRQPQPSLFVDISWGQSCVLAETMAIATHHGLSVTLLDVLSDIDRPEDLPLWQAYSGDANNRPQVRL
ncbi:glycosyltransferase [Leptolyngbya iicbica LK]|uniref:Glycosyltransferase n=3 Tax=Cyanophyceae TaxID=3028117 RepID=A0A4V2E2V6_9CYAN|nr:glycosyltransferase [Leptolyngbya sp. LK]